MYNEDIADTSLRAAIELVGDKWILLLTEVLLRDGRCRFLDLQNGLGMSPNTLSARLRRMEEAGLISRADRSGAGQSTGYGLTSRGAALAPVLDAFRHWADGHGTA